MILGLLPFMRDKAKDVSEPLPNDRKWIQTSKQILERLCGSTGLENLGFRFWDGTSWLDDSLKPATFILNRPSALRELLSASSEVAAGETYIRGAFDVEGDLIAAFEFADLLAQQTYGWTRKINLATLLGGLPSGPDQGIHGLAPKGTGRKHSSSRDQEAIRFHYDVSNEFYAAWLDSRMVYSCACFEATDESLETAQLRKLDLICRKLDLRPGERFLDIGCGWGALLVHAAKNYAVRAEGVTLSQRQFEYVEQLIERERLQDRITVRLIDYRNLPGTESYDKIASVGMVEHVGTPHLASYFQKVATMLAPGGLFLNHGIGLGPILRQNQGECFIQHYVFPDSDLQSLDEMLRGAAAARLEIRDVESLREHYARTLTYWLRGLEQHREEAIQEVGETIYRIWRIYMAGSAHGFLRGYLSVYQTLLAKSDGRGRVNMPMTRRAWYAKP